MEAVAFKGADIDDESSIISAAQQGDTDAT